MLKSGDLDFSFAGLKTSVLYSVKKVPKMTAELKADAAREFENAATEVLVSKTKSAAEKFGAKTLILGGGVSANKTIRGAFEKMTKEYGELRFMIPDAELSTDNGIMIAIAGYIDHITGNIADSKNMKAKGNLSL